MLMPPGLRMTGGEQRPSTMVLSTPTSQEPPSKITSMRPSRSWRTCSAVVVEGLVDALAEGAAMGTPASFMSESAKGESGMRTPKVLRPEVTSGASIEYSGFGRRIVRGPGQKRLIRGL